MIYLCCDKTWKLPSFKIGEVKLGITQSYDWATAGLQDWLAQTWNYVISPYTATKDNKIIR